jgi:hypothetical protein
MRTFDQLASVGLAGGNFEGDDVALRIVSWACGGVVGMGDCAPGPRSGA